MTKTLLLAALALSLAGCEGDTPEGAEIPPTGEDEVSTPSAGPIMADPATSDSMMIDGEVMLEDDALNSDMTQGEVMTDDML